MKSFTEKLIESERDRKSGPKPAVKHVNLGNSDQDRLNKLPALNKKRRYVKSRINRLVALIDQYRGA